MANKVADQAALEDAAAKQKAQSETMDEVEVKKLDETVPGGRYIVGGRVVNAEGEPIEDAPVAEKKSKKTDE